LEAHEAFEGLWRESVGPRRDFVQGWVLLSAALFRRDRAIEGEPEPVWSALGPLGAVARQVEGWALAEVLGGVESVLERGVGLPAPARRAPRSALPRHRGNPRGLGGVEP